MILHITQIIWFVASLDKSNPLISFKEKMRYLLFNGQYYLSHYPCIVTYTSLLLWLKPSYGSIYNLKSLECSSNNFIH